MTVKLLEWRKDTLLGGEGGFVGDVQYRHVRWDYGGARYGIENYPDMAAAKAKAQADHEAFILNALDVS